MHKTGKFNGGGGGSPPLHLKFLFGTVHVIGFFLNTLNTNSLVLNGYNKKVFFFIQLQQTELIPRICIYYPV